MNESAERRASKLQTILEVAKAMVGLRDLDRLLATVTTAAASVVEAERCTLFLVDRERGELWSKIAQGETREIRVPVGLGLAGHVAATGEAVRLEDAYADARFNRAVDLSTGFRTRSLLCVPMVNTREQVVGVLQALNRTEGVFTAEDEELLVALGGQAAMAIENAVLHEEIQALFEGFVRASVVAIESRDPTTAGHSDRVAVLTVDLARAAEKAPPAGPEYAGLRFSADDLKQLRYAALLHDFGKVGVREHVLVKADKLYPHERERLEARFELIRARAEVEALRARLEGRDPAGHEAELAELDALWDVVERANRPSLLDGEVSERLRELAARTFVDARGRVQPYLTPAEVASLSITRGTLTAAERQEIERHVTQTYRFLSQIAWTRELRRVPEIAWAHHEKLDGRGYPRGLSGAQVPIESRMMAIADIFDALTAADRPYKKAVPRDRALDILSAEAHAGKLDAGLLDVFVGARVWQATDQP